MATASRLSPGWVGALISGRMLRPAGDLEPTPRRNDHRRGRGDDAERDGRRGAR